MINWFLNERLEGLKSSPSTLKLNYRAIPVTLFNADDEGMKGFNKVVDFVIANYDKLNKINRTKSGGISIKIENINWPAYDIRNLGSCIELTLIACGRCYRVQFRADYRKEAKDGISGSKAWKELKERLAKTNVNLDDYKLEEEEAKTVKKSIPKAKIKLFEGRENRLYKHAHHIDIHSAYMGAIAEKWPEMRPAIESIYEERKVNPICKGILTHSFGYAQSACVGYAWSHLSKEAIEATNAKLEDLYQRLVDAKYLILGFNTDGIWYVGPEPYHGKGEGRELGQWQNDIIDVEIMFKSIGLYIYKDKEGYHTKARGKYRYELIKPRDKWTFEDLNKIKGGPIKYGVNEDGYIIKVEE